MPNTEIIVGTDGSPAGTEAVRWAAHEAHRRHLPLRIVHAFDWLWPGDQYGAVEELRQKTQGRADTVVSEAVLQAHDVAPELTVHGTAVLGEPAPVVLDTAKDAALVVVGSRGRGGFASLLLGSVGQRVATHAPCPTVVVRGRSEGTDGPVVVGVDGSAASQSALERAFGFAAERGADLVAIRAYAPTAPLVWDADLLKPVDVEQRRIDEHQAVTEMVAPWRDRYPQVRVEAVAAQGSAGRVLVGASHTAQLLVVGSRGHGGFAGTLLGSVGLQLVHHADCPVFIHRG